MIKNIDEVSMKLIQIGKKIERIRYEELKEFSNLFDYLGENSILNADVLFGNELSDLEKIYSDEEKEKISSENADIKIKEFIKLFEKYIEDNKINESNAVKFLDGLMELYKLTTDLQLDSDLFTINNLKDRNDIVNMFIKKFIDLYNEYVNTYHEKSKEGLNVKDMFLEQLDKYKEDLGDFSQFDTDFIDKYACSIALDILKKLLTQRFDNTLKQYNNDMDKAWDKFSIKRILNEAALYAEEFYLLDKKENPVSYDIRKHLRNYIHLLWDFYNKELKLLLK